MWSWASNSCGCADAANPARANRSSCVRREWRDREFERTTLLQRAEMGCFSLEGDEGGVPRSETAKLAVDIERILILQPLALSLPEYSESGDKGEFPPLPGPPSVAELPRRQICLWAYCLRSASSYTFMSNISRGGDTGDMPAPAPLNIDARLKGLSGLW